MSVFSKQRVVLTMLFLLLPVGVVWAAAQQEFKPATIWQQYAQKGALQRGDIAPSFMQDCARDTEQNSFIPQKNDAVARVMTYNVHFWTDPFTKRSYNDIIAVIKSVNADVVVLQEVRLFSHEQEARIRADFAAMGYNEQIFMPMNAFSQTPGDGFGNMILSKYPFAQRPVKKIYEVNCGKREKRNFIHAVVSLPDGNTVSVYGTHLDVWDESGHTRLCQAKELVEIAANDKQKNILLLADWNAVRACDYQYKIAGQLVWSLQRANFMQRVGNKIGLAHIPTDALEHVEAHGFKDCFTVAGLLGPKYTCWTGTVVDFIYCSKNWCLPIAGCYAYHDASSDHVPIVMDIALKIKAKL